MSSALISGHSAPKPGTASLPFELTSHIIGFHMAHLPYIRDDDGISKLRIVPLRSVGELLCLRLVCKSWDAIIMHLYLTSLRIHNSGRAQAVLNMWGRFISGDTTTPAHAGPAKHITITNILFKHPTSETSQWLSGLAATPDQLSGNKSGSSSPKSPSEAKINFANHIDFFYQPLAARSQEMYLTERLLVTMEQAVELINMLGENVTELNLTFYASIGFSSALVMAVKRCKHLKVLTITHSHTDRVLGDYDEKSLADLLDAAPHLERLYLERTNIGPLEFKPGTLSNLRYFCFMHESDYYNGQDETDSEILARPIEAIASICEMAKDSLKVVEFRCSRNIKPDDDSVTIAFVPIRKTLEGLFLDEVVPQIPEILQEMEFPRLRVLSIRSYPDENSGSLVGSPDMPMFSAVRMLAMPFGKYDQIYWNLILKKHQVSINHKNFQESEYFSSELRESIFQGLPSLKHCLFRATPGTTLNDDLVKLFKVCGIQCHLDIKCLTVDDIMEMDYELNGPMD